MIDMLNFTMSEIPPQTMLSVVENHILMTRGRRIKIIWPQDDRSLQLLGRAYDVAMGKEVPAPWDGGKSKICEKVKGASCMCSGAVCMRFGETDFLKKGEPGWSHEQTRIFYESTAGMDNTDWVKEAYQSRSSYDRWKESQKKSKVNLKDTGEFQKQHTYQKKNYSKKEKEFKTFCATCHRELDSCECKAEPQFRFRVTREMFEDETTKFSDEAWEKMVKDMKKKFTNEWFGPTCKTCGLYSWLCNCK